MGKKGGKRKTRWRVLPIGEDTEDSSRPRLGYHNGQPGRHHSPYRSARPSTPQQPHPPPASRTVSFNDDEYTKITTPRQDVLFKKGYLGRARPAPEVSEDAAAKAQVGEEMVPHEHCHMMNVPEDPYMYANGYVDHGNVYYMNGDGYELCNFTVLVGPSPTPAPVLAAIPCQPLPLQPLEWFNPPTAFVHCLPHMHSSSESQNSGPQSSESPGSPEECEEIVACEEEQQPFYPPHPPAYVYPGYMFGPPVFNMNGITIQGGVPQPLPTEVITVRHHKKKRRKRRHQGTVDDGSEGSSSYEKEAEKPLSQTESETSKDCEISAVNAVQSTESPIREVELEDNNEEAAVNEIPQEHISDSPDQSPIKDEEVKEEIAGIPEDQVSQSDLTDICREQNLNATLITCTEHEKSVETGTHSYTNKKGDTSTLKSEVKGNKKQLSESKTKKTKQSEKKMISDSADGLNVHETTGNKRSKKGSRGGAQNMTDVKKNSASTNDKGEGVSAVGNDTSSSITEINSSRKPISEKKLAKNTSKSSKGKIEQNEVKIVSQEKCDVQSIVKTEESKLSTMGGSVSTDECTNAEVHLIETSDSDKKCISDALVSSESLVKQNSEVCSEPDAFNKASSENSSDEVMKIEEAKRDFTVEDSESIEIELQRLPNVMTDSELAKEDINTDMNTSNSTDESSLDFATSNASPVLETPNEIHDEVNETISPLPDPVIKTLQSLNVEQTEVSNKLNDESKSLCEGEIESSKIITDTMLKQSKELQCKYIPAKHSYSHSLLILNPVYNNCLQSDLNHFSVMTYAEKTASNIMETAFQEIQVMYCKKLKITEAVEKWLYSQRGKEIICLDGDALKHVHDSSEEREIHNADEKSTNPLVPGPKNVLRNPLLASSPNFLSMDDASIRVAIKFCEECVSLNNLIPFMKLLNINSNMNYYNHSEKRCYSTINFCGLDVDCGFAFTTQNKKQCKIFNSPPKNNNTTVYGFTQCMEKCNGKENKQITKEVEIAETSLSEGMNSYDVPDSETECYIWDADLLKKQVNSQLDTEFRLESDNVSCMCDPSLFVGKYYSLGLPVERTNYDSQTDTESEEESALQTNSPQSWLSEASNSTEKTVDDDIKSEEAIDVIEAMNKNIDIFELNYMNFSEMNSGISSVACPHQKEINFVKSSDINMPKTPNGLHHDSALLMRHLKEKGPFPVGGICCLIQ